MVGYLQSTTLAIPEGREQLVALYKDLNSVPDWKWSTTVKVSAASKTALTKFWLNLKPDQIGRNWGPPSQIVVCDLTISTDASKLAWGAVLHGQTQQNGDNSFSMAR